MIIHILVNSTEIVVNNHTYIFIWMGMLIV